VLTRGGICVPPTVIYATCRTAFPAQHLRPSGVLSCWPDGLELSLSRILSGIQRAALAVLRVYSRRTCSCVISASSAQRVLNDIMRETNPRTCSLVYSRLTFNSVCHLCLLEASDLQGPVAFSALTLLAGRQEEHPACKKTERWNPGVVVCLDSGARCRLAYGPADATATHCLLLQ